jgi:hypothetical protein
MLPPTLCHEPKHEAAGSSEIGMLQNTAVIAVSDTLKYNRCSLDENLIGAVKFIRWGVTRTL